ncbi:MAG: hypothetical protein HY876_02310 [Coriobacteriales bacterium]|nr:hypothetical protein [Coriobacteriales bacterium]
MPEKDDARNGDSREDVRSSDPGPARERRKLRLPLKSALALVVVVLLVLPVFSTLQKRYYERYPNLHVRMENWRTSTHGLIPCSGCHVNPGARGLLSFSAKSIPAFYSQLLQGPRPTNLLTVPDRHACQKCHTTYRRVSASGDLLMPHRAHVEVLKINCATCHEDLVHSKNTQGFNSPEMSRCLERCHDGEKATDKCVKCHTRKHVPENHRRKDWLEVHPKLTETINCGECHAWSPDYCDKCHKERPKSHVGNWKKQHQVRAKARGSKGCLFCHGGEKFCKRCHD